ncbi:MAG TPA: sugar phosphate nucleotidyltransferase, partial [Steroidobacteraceae bacterium]|nr:sugar phosphate nucleotidyltransferase [Steroidobacteraceae bacterium]
GGIYRNIDFSLSNCVNSGIRRIAALTQYKSQSLIDHLNGGWNFLPRQLGEFIDIWPAQQRLHKGWYHGTADAVYQNLEMLGSLKPKYVLILAGDHVYNMDYVPMIEQHAASQAAVTIACIEVPYASASEFGVMQLRSRSQRITKFVEKPKQPELMFPGQSTVWASMGIYVFDFDTLTQALLRDAGDESSTHDFGKDVLPSLVWNGQADAFKFQDRDDPSKPGYWRDVGTVDAYWQSHMELLSLNPPLNLADERWPVITRPLQAPPTRMLSAATKPAVINNSIISPGCTIHDAVIRNSILSPGVKVMSGAVIEDSVLLPNVIVGRNAHVQRAVVDSDVVIADGQSVHHLIQSLNDETKHFTVTTNGVCLLCNIPKALPTLLDRTEVVVAA